MDSSAELPPGFADLRDLVADWAVEGMAARSAMRLARTIAELDRFYGRLVKRMDEIMAHLAQKPATEALPVADRNLYHLACAYMEVAPAVELFRDSDVPDGFPARQFRILSG